MEIVPDDTLEAVEAQIRNQDIGFVKPGQKATIKIKAFPYTSYDNLMAAVSIRAYAEH